MKEWIAFTSGGFLGIFGTSVFGIEQTTSFFILILFLTTMFYILFLKEEDIRKTSGVRK